MTLLAPDEGILLLEDGTVFEGEAVSSGTRFGEIVFNTAMTGYQEVLTDPSYRGQIVVMTQPHMGNYGIEARADESRRPWVEGFIARRFTKVVDGAEPLPEYLRRHGIPALEGIDTRALVRRLREHGALRAVVTTERSDVEELLSELRAQPTMVGRALVDEVTCEAPYELAPPGLAADCHLAVYDFGAKANILRRLTERGARLSVLPARTPAARCLELGVDGVVLSNGPGDPEALPEIVDIVRDLLATDLPILGICLGHQLLGLACGGRAFKLKFGHHGGNQPVQDLETGQVAITSQNHGFSLDVDSLPEDCRVTQLNLNDRTVEGFRLAERPVISVQYHPEAAPGPHDAAPIFGRFLDLVHEHRGVAGG